MNANCYYHSGKLPLTGMFMTVLVGAAAAAVLGVAYSYGIVYIPVIYANIVLTAFFGLGIAWVVTRAAKIGHVRSRIFPASAACIAALAGLYAAWGADMLARVGLPADGNFMVAFDPSVLWGYVQFFYEHGLWTIDFGHGANNAGATPVSGVMLGLVWLIEAGMVIGFASWYAWKKMSDLLYCEPCEKWIDVKKEVRRLRFAMTDADFGRILMGDLSPLSTLPRADRSAANYFRLDLGTCDKCADSNFLTIRQVMTVVDKKGKKSQQVTTLLRGLAIGPDDVARVREAGVDVPPPEFQAAPAPPPSDVVVGDSAIGETMVGADSAGTPAGAAPAKHPWE